MVLRAAVVMALGFACPGCDTSVAPSPAVEPPSPATPPDVSPEATPPVGLPAAKPVAVPVAAPAEVALAPTEEVAGVGRCKTDDDCVLSRWQSGCCVQACEDYASNRHDLAARQAKENCVTEAPEVCPPPAPCPLRTHDVLAARCSRRTCVSVQRKAS